MGDPYPKPFSPEQPNDDDGNVLVREQNSSRAKPNDKNAKQSKSNDQNAKSKSKGAEGKKSHGEGKKSSQKSKTLEKKAKVAAMDSMQNAIPEKKPSFWFTSFLLEMPELINLTAPNVGIGGVLGFFRDAKNEDPNPAAHSPWDFQLEDPLGQKNGISDSRRALTHYIKNAQVSTPVYDLENEFELNFRNNSPTMGYRPEGNEGVYGSRYLTEANNIEDPYLRRAVMTLTNSSPRGVKDLIRVTGKSFDVRFFYLEKGLLSNKWKPAHFIISPDDVYGNIITYPDKPLYTRWYQNVTGPGQAVLKRLDYVAASAWTVILDQAYKKFTSAYGKNGTNENSISKDGDPNYFLSQLTGISPEIEENFDLAKDNDKDKSKKDKPTYKNDTKIINDNYDLIKLIIMLGEKPDTYTSNPIVAAKVDNLRLINEAKSLFKEVENKINAGYEYNNKQYTRFRERYSVRDDDKFKALKTNLLGVVKQNKNMKSTLESMETGLNDKIAFWAALGNKATYIRTNIDTNLVNNIDIGDFKELCQQYKDLYHSSSTEVTEPQGLFQRAIAKAEIIVKERGTHAKVPKRSKNTYIVQDVKVVSTREVVTKPFTNTNLDETKITFRIIDDDAEKQEQRMTMSLRSFLDNASIVQAIKS